ncbi:FAD-dependent monooxygenase, putative [Plasmodium reichenowi]|uniref:FAD-dependent monooxygenase, putative n=1 Tax=Plasmodium reichenowi TaxID=5854 RepID=A0A2P9DBT8_PLARE|nr:FAD-dependent monooxygenase, putative [Plasmodium reichenowi]
MKVRKTFVLIIGGGPTGITSGLYLQKYNIPHILIEKDKCIEKIPKAHYYNNQTMEAWRCLYHLDKCFMNETEKLDLWKTFQYSLSMHKEKIISIYNNFINKYTYKNTYYEDISPSKVTHLSQYKLLGILYNYYFFNIKVNKKKREFLKNIKLKFSTYKILKFIYKNSVIKNEVNNKHIYNNVHDKKKEDLINDKFSKCCSYDISQMLIGYEFVQFIKNINELKNIDNFSLSQEEKIILEKMCIDNMCHDNKYRVHMNSNVHPCDISKGMKDNYKYDDNNNYNTSNNCLENSPNYVLTKIRNVETNLEEIVLSNYVFVCEGGKSNIKNFLNINDENIKNYMKFINIHFSSKYLSTLMIYNPSMLYFLFNEYIGILVCHDYKKGNVVLHIPYLTKREMLLYSNPKKIIEIINKLIGFNLYDIHIYNIYKWTMYSSIASTFVDNYTKRIFLLGDSAHKLPPSGGFGLNLGIGDVLNISWKIIRIFNLHQNKIKKFVFNETIKNNSTDLNDYICKDTRLSNSFINLIKNQIKIQDFIMNTLFTEKEKNMIYNYIQSYNIERKLVANFTISQAVNNYEKGKNIPYILGYNQDNILIDKLSKMCNIKSTNCHNNNNNNNNNKRCDSYRYNYTNYSSHTFGGCNKLHVRILQNSLIFHTLLQGSKKIINMLNQIPFIFSYKKKKIKNLVNTRKNVLGLLYPGADFCYSYINTLNNLEENINHHKVIKNNTSNYNHIYNPNMLHINNYNNNNNNNNNNKDELMENQNNRNEIKILSKNYDNINTIDNNVYERNNLEHKYENHIHINEMHNDIFSSEYINNNKNNNFAKSMNTCSYYNFENSYDKEENKLYDTNKKGDNNKIFSSNNNMECIPKLKVCKNIYEYEIPNIIGSKIPHFRLYTLDKNYVYKLSSVDLPILNNNSLSILIILFDELLLYETIHFLLLNNIPNDKFSLCLWDSDVFLYKDKTTGNMQLVKEEMYNNIDNKNISMDHVQINDYVLFRKDNGEHEPIGDISHVKYINGITNKSISDNNNNNNNNKNNNKNNDYNNKHNDKNNNKNNDYNNSHMGKRSINYVFTSRIIKEMFLNIVGVKSNNAYVILRPDKHIISVSVNNLFDEIKKINNIYI